jgi:hypothetical protein
MQRWTVCFRGPDLCNRARNPDIGLAGPFRPKGESTGMSQKAIQRLSFYLLILVTLYASFGAG